MNVFKFRLILLLAAICLSVSTSLAQQKIYLSGKDANAAVDWEFKVSEGRNSGFWTTISVPSNWEAEGFGYYLYGMDKMEGEKPCVGNYRHNFDFSLQPSKRYFIVFQGAMTDTKVMLNGKKVGFGDC